MCGWWLERQGHLHTSITRVQRARGVKLPPTKSPEDGKTELKLLTGRTGSKARGHLDLGLVLQALRITPSPGAYTGFLTVSLTMTMGSLYLCRFSAGLDFLMSAYLCLIQKQENQQVCLSLKVSCSSISSVDMGLTENKGRLREVRLHSQEHILGIQISWVPELKKQWLFSQWPTRQRESA